MSEWGVVLGRLVPYWLTALCSLWILAFLYAWTSDAGYVAYNEGMIVPVRQRCVSHLPCPRSLTVSPS